MFDTKTRVLIIDDMMMMRKLLGKICKDIGFTDQVEASDGEEAWKTITSSTSPIGLIISDWNMPNCTGIELLKKLRTDSKFAKIPFLMVTAEGEESLIAEALSAGADGVVRKPFTKEGLIDNLELVHKKYL